MYHYPMIMMILTVSFKTTPSYSSELVIRELGKDPLLILRLQDCRIQIGSFKIIHPINLTRLSNTISELDFTSTEILTQDFPFSEILRYKLNNLKNNFKMIRPNTTRHKRSIDAVGSAWKWIAGSPDAKDLKIISTSINQLTDGNNEQISINQQIDHQLSRMTQRMNEISQIANISINTTRELETLKLITNIDTINNVLEGIQDAVIGAKLQLPHSRILSIEEILKIKELLIQQGIKIDLLEEVFDYAIPKVTSNAEVLLYILEVPQMSTMASSILIKTMTVDGEKIIKHPSNLIKHEHKLYTTRNPQKPVQLAGDLTPFEDDCVAELILGRNATCTIVENTKQTIEYIANGKLMVDNAYNMALHSNCGPKDRKLTGNFLITFNNCTIRIANNTFTVNETTLTTKDEIAALYDLGIDRKILQLHNLEALREEALKTRKKLNHVYQTQQIWCWSILSKKTLLTICILSIICINHHRNKRTSDQVSQPQLYQIWLAKHGDVLRTSAGGVIGATQETGQHIEECSCTNVIATQ